MLRYIFGSGRLRALSENQEHFPGYTPAVAYMCALHNATT